MLQQIERRIALTKVNTSSCFMVQATHRGRFLSQQQVLSNSLLASVTHHRLHLPESYENQASNWRQIQIG